MKNGRQVKNCSMKQQKKYEIKTMISLNKY